MSEELKQAAQLLQKHCAAFDDLCYKDMTICEFYELGLGCRLLPVPAEWRIQNETDEADLLHGRADGRGENDDR